MAAADGGYGSRKFIIAVAVLGTASAFTAFGLDAVAKTAADWVSLMTTWGITASGVMLLYGGANIIGKKVNGGAS